MVLRKQNKYQSNIKAFFSWILYCYFEYWILNVFRTMLLKGNDIYSYSQNYFLLLFDIVIVITAAIFLVYWNESVVGKKLFIRIFLCTAIILYHIILLFVYYSRYNNFNASVYNGMIHDNTTYFGFVLFAVYVILCLSFERHFQVREWKIEESVIDSFVVTMFVYPVVETYVLNAGEFNFTLGHVWYWFLLFVMLAKVSVSLVCGITQGKLRTFLVRILWCFSICSYIQGMFLNGKLFLMDGKKAEWSAGFKIANIAVWCIFFVILYFSISFFKNKQKEVITFSSITLCVMQLVGVISLLPNYVGRKDVEAMAQNYLSEQGLYEVAQDENIIVFVLDTYDVDYIEAAIKEQPDFLAPLKGFTYFPDTVSQFSRTFPSIPYMMTNEMYFYELPLSEYVDKAFQNNSFWNELENQEFTYYLYEEYEEYIGSPVREKAKNFTEEGHAIEEEVSFGGCVEAIMRINNYRLLPYALKECYIYTSGTISDLVVEKRIWDIQEFVPNDIEIYETLKEDGLKLASEEKAFRFIHLNGAHEPYNMSADGIRLADWEGTLIEQCIGSMNLVYDYLQRLQELGVYEKSTIIITADHGENYITTELQQNTNPILFIKPFGVGVNEELKVSDVYASQNDMVPTIAAIHGIDYDERWGLDLFSTAGDDKNRTRYHYYAVVENTIQTKARTYTIEGSSLNFDNWYATEEYHEFGEYY